MKRSVPQEVRAGLAEVISGNLVRLKTINEDVMAEREVTVYVECTRGCCRNKHTGESMKKALEATVQKYDLDLIMKWHKFLADYGIGKPPEERQVEVEVRVGRLDELDQSTNEQLEAIRDGRALPAA